MKFVYLCETLYMKLQQILVSDQQEGSEQQVVYTNSDSFFSFATLFFLYSFN